VTAIERDVEIGLFLAAIAARPAALKLELAAIDRI
jgi:hypothetical protein